jgi:hypothetical protein
MIISPKNWMNLVAATLDDLPPSLREGLSVRPELLEPTECGHCKRAWFCLTEDGPRCAVCHSLELGALTAVELSVERPRISIYGDERIIVSAVLLRLAKAVEVVVPEAAEARFRAGSRKTENSAAALQERVRGVAFRALGLMTDAEGSWGWPDGERLQGGMMVPYALDALNQLDDDAAPAAIGERSGS